MLPVDNQDGPSYYYNDNNDNINSSISILSSTTVVGARRPTILGIKIYRPRGPTSTTTIHPTTAVLHVCCFVALFKQLAASRPLEYRHDTLGMTPFS